MDKTIIKKIEAFFETHVGKLDCFITSDEQLFYNRRSASDHGLELNNSQIYYVSRNANLEDWYNEIIWEKTNIMQAAQEAINATPRMDENIKRKWGWWNWLYKILH